MLNGQGSKPQYLAASKWRKVWFLFAMLFCALPAFAQSPKTVESTVCFQDPQSNCLANGTLILDLSQPATILSSGGQVAPSRVVITLTSAGLIPNGTLLWASDQLSPSGTAYLVQIENSNGTVVSNLRPCPWVIIGPSPIDLSQMQCTAINATYPYGTTGPTGPAGPTGATGAAGTVSANSGGTAGGNWIMQGPNPWADITASAFGARAVGITVYPHTTVAASGCVSTSPTVTLTAASTFQNGDGISLFGCGYIWNGTGTPSSTPGAPTVTNVIAAGGTALGGGNYSGSINVADGTSQGATTDAYKIIAADKYGGYTAVSTAGTTTTAESALGKQTCTINTETMSGNTQTTTFSSPCYVSAGAMVHKTGTSAADYTGWFTLATVNTGTYESMTELGPVSTTGLGGTTASSSGGTMAFYYANHLKWTPISGAWEYYVCAERSGDSHYHLIGTTKPSPIGSGWVESQLDDYGSPYMDSQTYPVNIELATDTPNVQDAICAAGSAVADPLTTTIVSGANTTSLVVAANAQTSSSGGVATFDDEPAFAAASASVAYANNSAGTVYIPPSTNVGQLYGYPIFSYFSVPAKVNFKQAGTVLVYSTIEFQGENDWDGSWANLNGPQFSNFGNSWFYVLNASPAIYVSGGGVRFHDGQCVAGYVWGNGGTCIVSDTIGGPTLDNFNMIMAQQLSSDYLSMCFVGRSTGSGGTDYWWHGVTCTSGPSQTTNKSWTPNVYFPPFQNGSGGLLFNQQIFFKCVDCNWSLRGIEQEQVAGNGGVWIIDNMHRQGGIVPLLLFGNSNGTAKPEVYLNSVILDTEAVSTVASVGNSGVGVEPNIFAIGLNDGSSDTGGIPPPFTGHAPNCVSAFPFVNIGDLPNTAAAGCPISLPGGYGSPGFVSAATYTTTTNCAANGTAANPSVVSCSAASAGMFSCSTSASTGTCKVNTTAVTANSEISITPTASDGGASQLNVTCNTGNVLSASAPLLASKSAGVSFTINLGTVSTNPACFEYKIVN